MRGHIVAENRFLHLGIDHRLFVTAIDVAENEYRFEVTRIPPGGEVAQTVFEKTIDFSRPLSQATGASLNTLIQTELAAIQAAVNTDEDLHIHDP